MSGFHGEYFSERPGKNQRPVAVRISACLDLSESPDTAEEPPLNTAFGKERYFQSEIVMSRFHYTLSSDDSFRLASLDHADEGSALYGQGALKPFPHQRQDVRNVILVDNVLVHVTPANKAASQSSAQNGQRATFHRKGGCAGSGADHGFHRKGYLSRVLPTRGGWGGRRWLCLHGFLIRGTT